MIWLEKLNHTTKQSSPNFTGRNKKNNLQQPFISTFSIWKKKIEKLENKVNPIFQRLEQKTKYQF